MPLMTIDGIDKLGFLIHDSARLLRKRFEAKGSGYGLSAAQWRLMVRLVKEEGVAQARLAYGQALCWPSRRTIRY